MSAIYNSGHFSFPQNTLINQSIDYNCHNLPQGMDSGALQHKMRRPINQGKLLATEIRQLRWVKSTVTLTDETQISTVRLNFCTSDCLSL